MELDDDKPCERLGFKKIQVSISLLLIITISCLWFIAHVTIKFFRRYPGKKWIFKVFLAWINFTLIFRVAFQIDWLINNWSYTCEYSEVCLNTFVSYTWVMFLLLAGILNIFIWMKYSLAFYSISKGEDMRNK